jgi:hypothetical protein
MAIVFNILTLTIASTTTSSNFFYNDYGIEHFITLNRLILIKTAKNIVTSMNNNAFIHGLTSSTKPSGIEPSSMEPSIVRSNDKDKPVNIENLTININFLNYYFDNDG